MKPPVEIDLLGQVSVPLFTYERQEKGWMTACLVGSDLALTSAANAPSNSQQIELRIDGESREARTELVDEAAGFALLRFSPPVTRDLPRVFGTQEQPVAPEAGFLTLVNLGDDRTSVSLSGVVIGPVTRQGKRFYRAEIASSVLNRAGMAGAPVVVGGRVLGLFTGGELPGRSEHMQSFLIAPFSGARGTPLAERLAAVSLPDRPVDPPAASGAAGLAMPSPSPKQAGAVPTSPASAAAGSQPGAQATAMPAVAAALAGFRSDGVSDQDDQLNIEHDVSALCSVIAAADVEPPLSIGLFGDWGSGKSFFIQAMQDQLDRIAKAAGEAEQAAIAANRPPSDATCYCARITQLEFNAWRYIDTDLWASLADGIIDGLARALERPVLDQVSAQVSATERARLLAAAAHSRDVIAEAEASKRAAETNLREQEQILERALARARAPRRGIAAVRKEARVLAIASSPTLRDELAQVTRQLGASAATAEAKAALLDLQGLWGTTRALWRAVRSNSVAAVIGIAVLAGLAVGGVVLREQIDAAIRVVVSAAVTVMTWFAAFRPYLKRARSAVGEIEKIVGKHGQALEAAQDRATEQERLKRAQFASAVDAADSRLHEARRDLEQLEAQLIALRADQQMATFLKERQASDDYRKHLGVIARARSDFERLSDLLFHTRDDAPRQGLPRIDRIVLYIDDLDRCDEEQVVKVLQAVHLLLAFKLFVVVVAVDSRWLLHSLQQHSTAFQADASADQGLSRAERLHWQSTPLNYLEKIFQIPFTLKPVGATGFESMIDYLTAPRAEPQATAGVATEAAQLARPEPSAPASSPLAAAVAAPADAATTDPATAPSAPAAAAPALQPKMVPQTEPARPAIARQRLADTPVDVTPDHLVIEPREQSFMKHFHELISTPRAIKRFVNVYRLVKARVPGERAAGFRGGEHGGEHRAAIFLLAMLTGFPSEATDMMRELTESSTSEDWWPWLTAFLGNEVEKAADNTAARPAAHERWLDLTRKLTAIQARFGPQIDLPSTEVFRFWTPDVAPFSFQAGRLGAMVSGALAAPATTPPAAHLTPTAAAAMGHQDTPDVH